jgi:hypothetical protein
VVGVIPEGQIEIDPEITEGHPGYEESGPSEIIPLERLRGEEGPESTPPAARAKAPAKQKRCRPPTTSRRRR